jgi:hypothetical protein
VTAATYDIYVEQGATFRMSLIYGHKSGTLDADGNEIITPYDLSGVLVRLQIRQRTGSVVLISATTGNGGIFLDLVTARVTITFPAKATDLLTMRRAKYDLELQFPSGDVVRLVQGKVTISAAITQGANLVDITSSIGPAYEVQEQDIPGLS